MKSQSDKTRTYLVRRESRTGDSETWHVQAKTGKEAYQKLGPWGSGWKKGYTAEPIKTTQRKKSIASKSKKSKSYSFDLF